MTPERCCLICGTALSGKQLRFCSRKHAMKWHNTRVPWREHKARHRKNAQRKAAYEANPEYWRNKAREYREKHPEYVRLISESAKRKHWTSPWRRVVINAKQRAKKKKLPFDLTFEWAKERWTGFCEISKMPFAPRYGGPSGIFSPSLDRIRASEGYTQQNCRFVLMGVNGLKNDGTDEAMYLVAEAILANRPV